MNECADGAWEILFEKALNVLNAIFSHLEFPVNLLSLIQFNAATAFPDGIAPS